MDFIIYEYRIYMVRYLDSYRNFINIRFNSSKMIKYNNKM